MEREFEFHDTGGSNNTIYEPSLLDADAWANKIPHETDNTSFDRPTRENDKGGKKGMAVQHH